MYDMTNSYLKREREMESWRETLESEWEREREMESEKG